MKVLEICLNASLGGLELYFLWCSEYFHVQHKNVLAVTLEGSRLDKMLREKGIPTAHLQRPGLLSLFFKARELASLIDRNEIDVVHVHFKNDLPLVALAKTLTRRKVKVVHTRQMEMPGSKKDLYHRMIYSQMDHVICITDKLLGEVRERLPVPAEKISRLYYGVRQPRHQEERAREFFAKFPSDKVKVAMFSRIEDGKGQDKLLQVLAQLRKEGAGFQAYIFGHFMKPEYEKVLRGYVKEQGMEDSVYWCGFQKDPVDLMPFFDVIVMPSVQETFGLVLIEAMAAQVASMGSDAGGVPEIIQDGVDGFTFGPFDVETFARKLKTLVTEPETRRRIAQAGHQKYLAEYTYDQHFQRLTKIFNLL